MKKNKLGESGIKWSDFLVYDHEAGVLIRKPYLLESCMHPTYGHQSGCEVGSKRVKCGGGHYLEVCINNHRALAHRVCWILHYGSIPDGLEIDHIDHNGLNNRIDNLRAVTRTENKRNCPIRSTNKSGFTGVRFDKVNSRWISEITVNGKAIYLGSFTQKEEAIKKRKEAEIKFNFHVNHGNPKITKEIA